MNHQEESEGQETGVLRRGMESLEYFSQNMEQRVEMYALVLVAICLCVLFKILNVNNSPEKSIFYCANQKFLEEFLKRAPELAEPYIPTRFWGFSGHLQTIIQVRLHAGVSAALAVHMGMIHASRLVTSVFESILW